MITKKKKTQKQAKKNKKTKHNNNRKKQYHYLRDRLVRESMRKSCLMRSLITPQCFIANLPNTGL